MSGILIPRGLILLNASGAFPPVKQDLIVQVGDQ